MALSRIRALFSLVVALLLAQALPFRHGSSRLCGSPVADLLLATLARLDGVGLIDLATWRNMVLVYDGILLFLLGDAGLLSTPTARRRRQYAEATAGGTTCYYSAPERSCHVSSAVVVWRRRARDRSAAASSASNAEEDPCAAPPLTEHERDEQAVDHVSTKEIVLVEEQGTYLVDRHVMAGGLDQLAPMGGKTISSTDSGRAVVVDHEKNGAEKEEEAAAEGEWAADECGEDLEEMNWRFEAFIASTKEKMRLEALQPVHVSAQNRRVLLA